MVNKIVVGIVEIIFFIVVNKIVVGIVVVGIIFIVVAIIVVGTLLMVVSKIVVGIETFSTSYFFISELQIPKILTG